MSHEPAGLVDLVPTICGLIGIAPPSTHLDGADLSEILIGKSTQLSRQQPLFWCLPLAGPAIALREGRYGMVAHRVGEVRKDHAAIRTIRQEIETLLKDKGILEFETRGSTLDQQIFEGFADADAEKLRGQFIRLNQFHESWIPSLKQSKFTRFELYDLAADPSQTTELSLQRPLVFARLKNRLLKLASGALDDAIDWSTSDLAMHPNPESTPRVHRLESTYRSPFDAFLYVNRIPSSPESDETPDDLAGRILGRLANQEGRVLVKLPARNGWPNLPRI